MYKQLGLSAVALLAAALAVLVARWPQGADKTFSQHAAAQRQTIWYYRILFAVVLPLLLLFFFRWFVPVLHMPQLFLDCVTVSAGLQFIVTVIPETGGWKTAWHRALTLCSALLLLPALALVIAAGTEAAGKVVALGGLTVMVGVIGMTVLRQAQKHALALQIAYYTAFFTAILFTTYMH